MILGESSNLPLWQDYLHTTFDLAHIGAELTFTLVFDLVIGALAWPRIKAWIAKHDKEEHGSAKK